MKIKFKKPKRLEFIALMVMLFSLFALFQASNLYLSAGLNWTTNLTANIPLPGALMFWSFFVIYHISMMFVMARSIIIRNSNLTWNGYDFIVGFLMVVGLYLVAISTIYGVYKGDSTIEFLWNFKYLALLQIGFFTQLVGVLWYAFTE